MHESRKSYATDSLRVLVILIPALFLVILFGDDSGFTKFLKIVGFTALLGGILFARDNLAKVLYEKPAMKFFENTLNNIDYSYYDRVTKTGLAISTKSEKIGLTIGRKMKTYSFGDIRSWESSEVGAGKIEVIGGTIGATKDAWLLNGKKEGEAKKKSGLVISVKDIASARWFISCDLDMQNKWMEILRQAVNKE